MTDIKDPLLEGKELSASEPESLTFEIPKEFNSVSKDVFQVVTAYLQLTWSLRKDGGKKIPFEEININTTYLFSNEGKYRDKLWKEHTATNLRELFYDLNFPDDYCRAIKNISPDEMDPQNGLIGRIYKIKLFLDLIIHYRWSAAIKKTKELYDDNDLVKKDIDGVYERVCIDLYYTFYELYKNYAFDDNYKQ